MHDSRVRLLESLPSEILREAEPLELERAKLMTSIEDLREDARHRVRWGSMSALLHRSSKSAEAKIEAAIAKLNEQIGEIELRGITS